MPKAITLFYEKITIQPTSILFEVESNSEHFGNLFSQLVPTQHCFQQLNCTLTRELLNGPNSPITI